MPGGTDGARSARHPWTLCSWGYSDSDAGLPGRTSNFLMSPLLCLWGRFLDFYFATLSLITHSYYQNFNNIHEFCLPSPPRTRWLPRALLVGMDASLPSRPLSSGLRAAAYPAGPGQLLGRGGRHSWEEPPWGHRCLEERSVGKEPSLPTWGLGCPAHADVPEALSPAPASRALQWLGQPSLVTGLSPVLSVCFPPVYGHLNGPGVRQAIQPVCPGTTGKNPAARPCLPLAGT